MEDHTPRFSLNIYDQGAPEWDHTDAIEWIDRTVVAYGELAARPDEGEYDYELYHATDVRVLYRWNASDGAWEPLSGMGTDTHSVEGEGHFEQLDVEWLYHDGEFVATEDYVDGEIDATTDYVDAELVDHTTNGVHNQPQPAQVHGNEDHDPAFAPLSNLDDYPEIAGTETITGDWTFGADLSLDDNALTDVGEIGFVADRDASIQTEGGTSNNLRFHNNDGNPVFTIHGASASTTGGAELREDGDRVATRNWSHDTFGGLTDNETITGEWTFEEGAWFTGGYQDHITLDRYGGDHIWNITQSVDPSDGESIRFEYDGNEQAVVSTDGIYEGGHSSSNRVATRTWVDNEIDDFITPSEDATVTGDWTFDQIPTAAGDPVVTEGSETLYASVLDEGTEIDGNAAVLDFGPDLDVTDTAEGVEIDFVGAELPQTIYEDGTEILEDANGLDFIQDFNVAVGDNNVAEVELVVPEDLTGAGVDETVTGEWTFDASTDVTGHLDVGDGITFGGDVANDVSSSTIQLSQASGFDDGSGDGNVFNPDTPLIDLHRGTNSTSRGVSMRLSNQDGGWHLFGSQTSVGFRRPDGTWRLEVGDSGVDVGGTIEESGNRVATRDWSDDTFGGLTNDETVTGEWTFDASTEVTGELGVGEDIRFTDDGNVYELGVGDGSLEFDGDPVGSGVFVSASDHGAVGDGSTDDTNAIQSALDEAKNEDATCYIPGGTYLISETVFVGCDVLAAQDAVLLADSDHTFDYFQSGNPDAPNSYTHMAMLATDRIGETDGPTSNIEIRNLTIDYDNAPGEPTDADGNTVMWVDNAEDVLVDGLTILNGTNRQASGSIAQQRQHVLYVTYSDQVHFRGCHIEGGTYTTFSPRTGAKHITYEKGTIYSPDNPWRHIMEVAPGPGTPGEQRPEHITFRDVHFLADASDGIRDAIASHNGGRTVFDSCHIEIHDATEDFDTMAKLFDNSGDQVIKNCTFESINAAESHAGVWLGNFSSSHSGVDHMKVVDNLIRVDFDARSSSVWSTAGIGVGYQSSNHENIDIARNDVEADLGGIDWRGIHFEDADTINVTDNNITIDGGATTEGIVGENSENVTVSDNSVIGDVDVGIEVTESIGPSALVYGNHMEEASSVDIDESVFTFEGLPSTDSDETITGEWTFDGGVDISDGNEVVHHGEGRTGAGYHAGGTHTTTFSHHIGKATIYNQSGAGGTGWKFRDTEGDGNVFVVESDGETTIAGDLHTNGSVRDVSNLYYDSSWANVYIDDANAFRVRTDTSASSGDTILHVGHADNSSHRGMGLYHGDFEVTDGDVIASGTKDFAIDHPTEEGKRLHHAAYEGPRPGMIYEDTVTVDDDTAEVAVPDYVEGGFGEGFRAHATPVDHFGSAYVDTETWTLHAEEAGEYHVLITGRRNDPGIDEWESVRDD